MPHRRAPPFVESEEKQTFNQICLWAPGYLGLYFAFHCVLPRLQLCNPFSEGYIVCCLCEIAENSAPHINGSTIFVLSVTDESSAAGIFKITQTKQRKLGQLIENIFFTLLPLFK